MQSNKQFFAGVGVGAGVVGLLWLATRTTDNRMPQARSAPPGERIVEAERLAAGSQTPPRSQTRTQEAERLAADWRLQYGGTPGYIT